MNRRKQELVSEGSAPGLYSCAWKFAIWCKVGVQVMVIWNCVNFILHVKLV